MWLIRVIVQAELKVCVWGWKMPNHFQKTEHHIYTMHVISISTESQSTTKLWFHLNKHNAVYLKMLETNREHESTFARWSN